MDIAFASPSPAAPSAGVAHAATLRARWRILLTYRWRHGRWPDLDEPRLFTELVQARKLAGHDRAMVLMADKVAAKALVAEAIGPEWLIPTLWQGIVLPDVPRWPTPFVVKARHGCNQNAFVLDGQADWAAIRARAAGWMRRDYGWWLDEPVYRAIPRGLLVEPFMGTPPALPLDYKFYVFGGEVAAVQVHLGRGARHRWILFDRAWRRISASSADADPAAPASLARMIAAAEKLSEGRDFCRVDLYEIDGRPLFGELTFYPGSGLDRFDPVALDAAFGAHWLAARGVTCSGPRVVQPRELIRR